MTPKLYTHIQHILGTKEQQITNRRQTKNTCTQYEGKNNSHSNFKPTLSNVTRTLAHAIVIWSKVVKRQEGESSQRCSVVNPNWC